MTFFILLFSAWLKGKKGFTVEKNRQHNYLLVLKKSFAKLDKKVVTVYVEKNEKQ